MCSDDFKGFEAVGEEPGGGVAEEGEGGGRAAES